ncbi:UvrD-helicase domain-containing protein [Pseudoalteromonas nigrifaciens]|uniref:UvrD-helicase domain-containing protein n=1 Tax=Pseudoalteromonas nigrifaciens TaxID=28109 RepID=UPI003FCF6A0E
MLLDSSARHNAMALESKLIKAPAGSGKTGLLTNYFLKLLGLVEHPREIKAMTFTNKSCAEMKDRIIASIIRAKGDYTPNNDYEKENYELAKKALQNSINKGWNIEKNSNMLNIGTIDSFCKQLLVDHVGSGQLATRNVAHDPKALYQKAISETLSLYGDPKYGLPIQKLLSHFGNKVSMVERLLVEMIETRERWIPVLFIDKEAARVELEAKRRVFLSAVLEDDFTSLQETETELQEVISKLDIKDESLCNFVTNGFQADLESNKCLFASLKKLLCTSANKPKVRFTKNEGVDKSLNKEDRSVLQADLKSVSQKCANDLIALGNMPDSKYKESEWVLLTSVFSVMPLILAKLKLVFQSAGEVDFTEVSLNAVRALDSESGDATTTAISKSQTIKHLLVDEFQDSNNTQLMMIRLLTEAWSQEDGNTLFLVGDAMQSIYGFRAANVNVFMDAENGVGNIDVKTHTLSTNFRSTPGVVDWVNTVFSEAFPKENNMLLSASKYSPSSAVKLSNTLEEPVELHGFHDDFNGAQEARYIADKIKEINKAEPNASIAVLGRTRTSLKSILELFNNDEEINATAVKLNRIDKEPLCILAIAVARLLIDDMDKLAWLTVLNSGLFGLTHSKIEAIFKLSADPYLAVNDDRVVDILDSKQLIRYTYALNEINMAIEVKHHKEFDLLLEGLWYNLHGPSLADKEIDLENVALVFSLFENTQSSDLSLRWFERQLESLYAESKNQSSHISKNVEIMTLHSAKGLEFDYIFMPGMHKRGVIGSDRLFSWANTGDLGDVGVMACSEELGIKSSENSYHRFIGQLNKKREHHELKRLVYVGVTRAIKKAFLTGKIELTDDKELKQPLKGTMFDVVESVLEKQLTIHQCEYEGSTSPSLLPKYSIIEANLQLKLPVRDTLAAFRGTSHLVNNAAGVVWDRPISRIEGVVIQNIIEQICKDGIALWDEERVKSYSGVILATLKELSVGRDLLIASVRNVKDEINRLLSCDVFRALCQQHKLDNTELSMSVRKNRKIHNLIIDKGFVTDDGVAHIIDWKSAAMSGGESVEGFIKKQLAEHKVKSRIYGDAYRELSGANSVESALYFTKTNNLARCI